MQFDGRASPVPCNTCNHTYHRKCLQSRLHVCKSGPVHHHHYGAVISTVRPIPTTTASLVTPVCVDTTATNNTIVGTVATVNATNVNTIEVRAAPATVSSIPADYPTQETQSASKTTHTGVTTTPSVVLPTYHARPNISPSQLSNDQSDLVAPLPVINTLPTHPTVNHSQQKSKSKQKQNTNKNVLATDKTGFDLECKRKQLVAAEAKIQELEVEITKLKKTNFILGERIKMFENVQNRELHEKYFPSQPTTGASDPPRPGAACTQHHCCAPPPPLVQCHGHGRCYGPSPPTLDISAVVLELSEKVTQLSDSMATIKSVLNKFIMPCPTVSLPQQQTTPSMARAPPSVVSSPPQPTCTQIPLTPEIIVIENLQAQETPQQVVSDELIEQEDDESMMSDTNTIDDFVFEEQHNTNNLNCLDLTNQSIRLVQPNLK